MITPEQRLALFQRAECLCEVCQLPIVAGQPQLAHRIPKTITNLRKYGVEVIDHDLNLAVVESLKCNSAVILHDFEERALVARIREALDD